MRVEIIENPETRYQQCGDRRPAKMSVSLLLWPIRPPVAAQCPVRDWRLPTGRNRPTRVLSHRSGWQSGGLTAGPVNPVTQPCQRHSEIAGDLRRRSWYGGRTAGRRVYVAAP